MKKILVFNWKMNPNSLKETKHLFDSYIKFLKLKTKNSQTINIIIAPPFVYLENLIASAVVKGYSKFFFASQDVFWEDDGAYTGGISPAMLKNLGVEYVIIGHSERRKYLDETDEMINRKVLAAVSAGLKVILCVGEDWSIRQKGKKIVEDFIKKQLEKDLKNIQYSKFKIQDPLIIAYEPVWSIGTGQSDSPEDAVEVIKFIKQTLQIINRKLQTKILYGGSIDGKDIKDFVKYNEIDGYLIGGASLKPSEVNKIIQTCLEK